jgi:hypothetical protein
MSIFCDSLYSVSLFNAVLGLDFLGLALSQTLREPLEAQALQCDKVSAITRTSHSDAHREVRVTDTNADLGPALRHMW